MSARAEASARASGIGFGGLLGLLFIGLKLTGHINWAWIWVLAPLWIPAALVLLILTICLIVYLVAG